MAASSRPPAVAGPYVRGAKLGLPPDGPGSLAPTGRRIAAFLVDAIVSGLLAALFVSRTDLPGVKSNLPGLWSYVPLTLIYVFGMLFLGKTLGMHLLGLRIIRVDRVAAVNPWRAIVRTALLLVLVPAVVFDRDGRGLHDRFADTAVIRDQAPVTPRKQSDTH